jgi:drug/metabolite transporter (DMT)-like permease
MRCRLREQARSHRGSAANTKSVHDSAPVMNIEPLATLLVGWIVLDQMLSSGQLIGGVIVVTGIVLLTYRKTVSKVGVNVPA